MLVLTRRSLEAVVVGGVAEFEHQLKITVLEIRGGKVRLGFEVDAAVPVHRWEVWERIRAGEQLDRKEFIRGTQRSSSCSLGEVETPMP